jgi:nitroreductase
MRFLELVERRQSDRGYLASPVERDKLERCLEAARLAPSASNAQPWHFVVVDDPEVRSRMERETHGPFGSFNRFTRDAPVFVALVVEPGKAATRLGGWLQGRNYGLIDAGIAAEHFCLQAVEEGLGTCMMGIFNEREVRRLLGVPRGRRVQLVIAVGYPEDARTREKRRKSLEMIRSYNRYAARL